VRRERAARLALLASLIAGCAHARAVSAPSAEDPPLREVGLASFYSSTLVGHRTASGEPYRPEALTAAHRRLRFGTHVRVTARQSGRSVVVRINDRGPFVPGRIVDLSREAARQIGLLDVGVLEVAIEVLPPRGGEALVAAPRPAGSTDRRIAAPRVGG